MDKIYNFLCLKSIKEQKNNMKTWLGLYVAFTIVFMDFGFLLNFSNKANYIFIPIIFTLLVFALLIIYLLSVKRLGKYISFSILYCAIANLLICMLFYTLFLLSILTEKISFNISHFIGVLISFVLWIVVLVYRNHKFKHNVEKFTNTKYRVIIYPLILIFMLFLKNLINGINKWSVLTVLFLILGGIWFLISLTYFQNYYYAKKNNIDKDFC